MMLAAGLGVSEAASLPAKSRAARAALPVLLNLRAGSGRSRDTQKR